MAIELSEKLGIVLLAAGGSRRLGQPKQLLQIEGESLVFRAARSLLGLDPARLVVVTGASSAAVNDQLAGLPAYPVHNPDWSRGMGTSIALGLRNLPRDLAGVLIMPCDQWRVDLHDLERLTERWIADISFIVTSTWNATEARIYGPPAIFPRKIFHELMSLDGDVGARSIIEKYRSTVEFVPLENAAFDVDVPADLCPLEKL